MAHAPGPKGTPRRAIGRNAGIAIIILMFAGVLALNMFRKSNQQPGPAQTNEVMSGQQVYAQYCASCHGINLAGQPNWQAELPGGGRLAPPHDQSGHTWHHPDQQLFDITKYGGQRFSPPDYRNNMPGYEGRLTDEQIWAVLAYIKSTWPPEIREAQAKLNP